MFHKTSIFLVFIFVNSLLTAQTPCFSSNDTIGCLPHTVTLSNCSEEQAIVYVYEENGQFDTTTSNTYTYTSGGRHSITQLIGTSTGIKSLTKDDYIKVIDNPKPSFSLTACEGLKIIINITYDNYEKYIITYDDGSPNDTVAPHSSTEKTYTSNGLKSIAINGFYENLECTNSDEKTIQTIVSLEEPQLINLSLDSLDSESGQTTLSFNTNSLLEYYYEQKLPSSTYQIIDSIQPTSSSTTIITSNINTTISPICYHVHSFDRCGNNVVSKEICSVHLTTNAISNQNELTWNAYNSLTDISEYHIYKDNFPLISTSSPSHIDNDVFCGTQYCYQIDAELNIINNATGLPVTSTSQISCIKAVSTDIPPIINNLHSSFSEDLLSIHWNKPSGAPVKTYTIQENLNNNGYTIKDTFSTADTIRSLNSFTEFPTSACYKISYEDICGNLSPISDATCPTLLSISKIEDTETHKATWTNYIGFETNSYYLNMFNVDFELIDQIELGLTETYTFEWPNNEDQFISFSISASSNSNSFIPYSNFELVEESTLIIVPNAFSPNEDNLNDLFRPQGRFLDTYSISIFNSMGTILFVSDDLNSDWNGKSNDNYVPEGTYYYEMSITDKKGEKFTRNGSVTVIY